MATFCERWQNKTQKQNLKIGFIVGEDIKEFYYRGLREWNNEKGYLKDTILSCQDQFKTYMDYFGLEYRD